MSPSCCISQAIHCVLVLSLLLVASLTSGCGQSVQPPGPATLRIAGSTSMHRVMEGLGEAYSREHSHVRFDLDMHGSGLGLDLVRARQADLAAISWPPDGPPPETDEETAVRFHPVALDAISVIVHPVNPLEEVSVEDVRAIFRGRIGDWSELRGRVGDILVVSREDGSGLREAFEGLVMDREPVTLAASVRPGSREVVEYVARHPHAIGYVGMGDLTEAVKALRLDGVEPRPETVANGSYPLICPLALAVADPPGPAVQDFLAFISAPSGQEIVKALYALAPR